MIRRATNILKAYKQNEKQAKGIQTLFSEEKMTATLDSLDNALDSFVAQTNELVQDCENQQAEEIARHEKEAAIKLEAIKTSAERLEEKEATIRQMKREAEANENELKA